MRPEDPFDAAHMAGAAAADRFLEAMLGAGELPPEEARRHADNAYVLVEFLANTYPKVPEEAHERDVWVFLFDYYISQGPFEGPAVAVAPRSVRLFFEFLARDRRLDEIPYIRQACEQPAFYAARVDDWARVARAAADPSVGAEEVDGRVAAWQEELAGRMRPRGLVPDAALARGEGGWGLDMGPLEAAVFDAVCVVLARAAREFSRRRAGGAEVEARLLAVQDQFMRARNPGLGVAPLEAVLRERAEPMGPR
ncbi:MAG TPA: hypothetical protein VGB42_02050 [Candidatus Thermoplasmatota archaeon]